MLNTGKISQTRFTNDRKIVSGKDIFRLFLLFRILLPFNVSAPARPFLGEVGDIPLLFELWCVGFGWSHACNQLRTQFAVPNVNPRSIRTSVRGRQSILSLGTSRLRRWRTMIHDVVYMQNGRYHGINSRTYLAINVFDLLGYRQSIQSRCHGTKSNRYRGASVMMTMPCCASGVSVEAGPISPLAPDSRSQLPCWNGWCRENIQLQGGSNDNAISPKASFNAASASVHLQAIKPSMLSFRMYVL